jgi:hypothetical protein
MYISFTTYQTLQKSKTFIIKIKENTIRKGGGGGHPCTGNTVLLL